MQKILIEIGDEVKILETKIIGIVVEIYDDVFHIEATNNEGEGKEVHVVNAGRLEHTDPQKAEAAAAAASNAGGAEIQGQQQGTAASAATSLGAATDNLVKATHAEDGEGVDEDGNTVQIKAGDDALIEKDAITDAAGNATGASGEAIGADASLTVGAGQADAGAESTGPKLVADAGGVDAAQTDGASAAE